MKIFKRFNDVDHLKNYYKNHYKKTNQHYNFKQCKLVFISYIRNE